jgi:hypothetical protein
MKYKKIITSGCSFSDPVTPYTWVNLLERHIKKTNPDVAFDHRGLSSQGQQLIQKKAVHAIWKALSEGYKPEEICVFVMWSGHERRSFYIKNKDTIERLSDHWKKNNHRYQLQFGDLENKGDSIADAIDIQDSTYPSQYNKNGGWYITGGWHAEVPFFKEYLMFCEGLEESIMLSLDNMVMLQSVCKSLNIKLYEQFYMDTVYETLNGHKDYPECKHLYGLLDQSNYVTTKSIHGYLKSIEVEEAQYFKDKADPHPNAHGHLIWLHDILLPHLEKTGFFK